MPGGGLTTTLITLGYDPTTQRFVGTFVGSMMAQMWIYDGSLDATGRILTLDTEGPSFTPEGGLAKYQDIVEVIDPDHHILSSRVQGRGWQVEPFYDGTLSAQEVEVSKTYSPTTSR